MKYSYFVSYLHGNVFTNGFGNVLVDTKRKIDNIETIKKIQNEIQKMLKENEHLDTKVIIINYQLLKKRHKLW